MTRKRSYFLDIARVLIAYQVVLIHSSMIHLDYFPGTTLCPDFFFVVTGALMHMSIEKEKRGSVAFIAGKYKRILPFFFLTEIPAFVMIEISKKCSFSNVVGDFMNTIAELCFLRMAGWNDGYYINPVTWHLSAMLIALMILYPMAEKWTDECATWIFPIITIAFSSYMIRKYGTIGTANTEYSMFCLDAVKRAMAGIAFGYSLYELTKYLKRNCNKKSSRWGLAIAEVIGYGSSIFATIYCWDTNHSVLVIAVMGIAVAISLSGKGFVLPCEFPSVVEKALKGMGVFSLSLYLSHYEVTIWLNDFCRFRPESRIELLMLYVVLSTIVALINIMIVDLISKAHMVLKMRKVGENEQ